MLYDVLMTDWLTDSERAAWVRLASVIELLPGALDSQLRRDSDLTHFEYYVLAMLSEAPDRTLRMSALAGRTSGTLSRLSHVVSRLESDGLVERLPCPSDRRATNARLTDAGFQRLVAAAPGHVAAVREHVVDALSPRELAQLTVIADKILAAIGEDAVQVVAVLAPA
jgi:DNA-binding MarR family transcriptional regulator